MNDIQDNLSVCYPYQNTTWAMRLLHFSSSLVSIFVFHFIIARSPSWHRPSYMHEIDVKRKAWKWWISRFSAIVKVLTFFPISSHYIENEKGRIEWYSTQWRRLWVLDSDEFLIWIDFNMMMMIVWIIEKVLKYAFLTEVRMISSSSSISIVFTRSLVPLTNPQVETFWNDTMALIFTVSISNKVKDKRTFWTILSVQSEQ